MPDDDEVTLTFPRERLAALQLAWQLDDSLMLTVAVRDLFQGQDGTLVLLDQHGVTG